MNPLEKIRKKLIEYHDLNVVEEDHMISIEPTTQQGFEVWFSNDESEYTVGFDGWHQHFDKSEEDDALNCFAFGLTKECRLKVFSRGGKRYKWVVEAFENEQWVQYSTTALVNFAFWKKARIEYLLNDILK